MKIAISVPDHIFEAGEQLAEQLGLSRNQLYSNALAAYVSERAAAAVTNRLNDIYSDESAILDKAVEESQWNQLANEAW